MSDFDALQERVQNEADLLRRDVDKFERSLLVEIDAAKNNEITRILTEIQQRFDRFATRLNEIEEMIQSKDVEDPT